MKPFNIELAKAGHPVCTRNGKDARIICFDRKNNGLPIIGLIKENDKLESICSFTDEGKFDISGNIDNYDLFMKSTKKEGWINIYKNVSSRITSMSIHNSKEEAFKNRGEYCLDTIKIEWEE